MKYFSNFIIFLYKDILTILLSKIVGYKISNFMFVKIYNPYKKQDYELILINKSFIFMKNNFFVELSQQEILNKSINNQHYYALHWTNFSLSYKIVSKVLFFFSTFYSRFHKNWSICFMFNKNRKLFWRNFKLLVRFNNLKKMVIVVPILALYKKDLRIIVELDSSNYISDAVFLIQ